MTPPGQTSRRIRWIPAALLLVGLCAVAAGVAWMRARAQVRHVPILMYHKIGDDADSPWWVSRADFEAHLQCLKEQGYTSILPADLAAHRAWGKPLPARPVIITFDDGYLNTVEAAEPLLQQYGFRGVCYLITGQVSPTPESRHRYEGAPILSWPEVRAAARRGTLVFGGHTRSHANLRAMDEPSAELKGCFDDLRREGHLTPAGFCYPFGQYQSRTPGFVARAGFTTAVTCDDGIALTTPRIDLFELPRISVMGGRHRYHVERPGDARDPVLRVWKEGHAMKVYPRWLEAGADAVHGGTWGAPARIDTSPTLLALPTNASPAVLELWDDFRVLRLYRQAVP